MEPGTSLAQHFPNKREPPPLASSTRWFWAMGTAPTKPGSGLMTPDIGETNAKEETVVVNDG